MKIAVATDGKMVAQHFGHCPEYTIAEVEDGKILMIELIPNPGHEPGFLPKYLGGLGIKCIIAGEMGGRAQSLFADNGIETFVGISGEVKAVLEDYLKGDLISGESTCTHDCG